MQYTGASNADLVLAIPMLVGTKNFTAYCMNKKATQRGVGIMTLPCGKPLHPSGAAGFWILEQVWDYFCAACQ